MAGASAWKADRLATFEGRWRQHFFQSMLNFLPGFDSVGKSFIVVTRRDVLRARFGR